MRASLLVFAVAAMFVALSNKAIAAVRTASSIGGIHISALSRLPPAPASAAQREGNCHNVGIEPISPAGKFVEKQGWAVTGEARLGTFDAISVNRRSNGALTHI